MYSPAKIEFRLQRAKLDYDFEPMPHTPEEIEEFEERLRQRGRYLYDDFGHPLAVQNVSEEERRWMLNERVLCQSDALYTLTRYGFIKNEQNVIQRFQPRVPQQMLFGIIADLEAEDASIELMILKARQLGVSTLTELLISHRIIFSYGVNAIIGSADRVKTGLMANMHFLFYDMLPVWLRPHSTRRVESDQGMHVFGELASGVSFQHGSQTSGIARGTTPTIYHLAECASYTDAVRQIEASLFKAVHASPQVFGVLESTGEGDKGWWPDTWRHAKSNWHHRRSRLYPVFLPWFCGTDLSPTPTWLRMRPVPANWLPNQDTRRHVAKSELYVRSTPMLSKLLGSNYSMPREQQWWWEVNHEEMKAKGIESVFLQETAGDDEEALQRSSESVFGHQTIYEIASHRKTEYEFYGLTGQSIEDSHEPPPEYIDYDKERIPIKFSSPRNETYRWELVPLRFPSPPREDDPDDVCGMLVIFHRPKQGVSYSIGVDTSEGKGEDSTVISVWSVGKRNEPDVQCAEFASSFVNHVEAFSFILAIAAYYGQYMAQGVTRWKQPYISIEQVQAVGDTAQLQMARMGYTNFHRMARYDDAPKKIFHRKRGSAGKRGWYTWGWSRPILLGNFVHFAQNGWTIINSPWLIEEMKHFEVHITATGREKMEHEEGEHDDRIFAAAMASFCPHDLDVIAERSKKRAVEFVGGLPPIDIGPYTGPVVTASEIKQRGIPRLEDIVYADSDLERLLR